MDHDVFTANSQRLYKILDELKTLKPGSNKFLIKKQEYRILSLELLNTKYCSEIAKLKTQNFKLQKIIKQYEEDKIKKSKSE